MKSPNYIFPILIAFISSVLILNGSSYTYVKASDGINPGTSYFKMSPRVTADDYKSKTVILKINQELRPYCNPQQISLAPLQNLLNDIGATGVKLMFPHSDRPTERVNKYGMKYADLSLIYEFKYTSDKDLVEVINSIHALGISEYVQPYYIHKLHYTPNDPQIGSQYHIARVKAYQAWDIQKGKSSVTVAIIDSGSDADHEEFIDQLAYNTGETLDGTDSDGDGYIDNNLGWDFVDDDNNTQMAGSNHGVHVAGCAVAATDNGKGVAGPAFGCSYLPVKAGDGSTIGFGYPGITYAADHGASVINCSWGGAGGGQLGQDVITYATINKDALVVASAGNDAVEDVSYPAGYEYVLNVGSTASNDTKSGFSNYGYTIDLCAPGSSIYATDNDDGYTTMSGTSMSSPVAAGCAALVRSEFGFLDALQAAEQLKVTCDNIYPVNQSAYQDKLGAGRINLFNAVSGITLPSIVMTEDNVTDNGDEAFVVGDTLSIDGIFTNFLAPSGPITATISSQSAYVAVINASTSLGAIGAFGGSANNAADPFTVTILPGAAFNEKATFEIELTDGSYTTSVFLTIIVNVDYINIAINEVATSITSKSLTGFNDFSSQLEGLGFVYPYSITGTGENILFDCGLMIGTAGNVSDNVRTTGGGTDEDFVSVSNVQRLPVPVFSEFDLEGEFDDAGNGTPLGVDVRHKAFAWSEAGHRKYVIVEYSITNNSSGTLNALYAGLYADWDITAAFDKNKGGTVLERRLGYIYDSNPGGVWAGMQVVSISGDFVHNAMFNNTADDPSGGGVYPNNAYATADKYASLSTMDLTSGGTNGADVSNVVSTGPFNLAVGDSVVIAFAIMAGDDEADITETADSAYTKYNPCSDLNTVVTSTDATCGADGQTVAQVNVGLQPFTYLWSDGQTTSNATGLTSGTYQVTTTTGNGCVEVDNITVGGGTPFTMTYSSTDATCGASDGQVNVSVLTGTAPYTFIWDANAGSQTDSIATNLSAGVYSVSVTGGLGCENIFNIVVSNAGAGVPSITIDQDVSCAGGNDGQVTASMNGGSSPFTYTWSSGDTMASVLLSAGDYSCVITDAAGCLSLDSVTLTDPIATTADTASTGDDGTTNGTATITTTAGTGPFSYAWDTSPSQSTATATGLSVGTYMVTVTDGAGCESFYTVIVSGVTIGIANEVKPFVSNIYPNPNDGAVTVVFGDAAIGSAINLSLRNLLGQEVLAEEVVDGQKEITLNLQSLNKGAYFLTVGGEGAKQTFKILVQ